MKAKNSKTVMQGYLLFAFGLCCSIIVGTGCIWLFIVTSNNELAKIERRSIEYDLAFARQISLTEKVDSLYYNLTLLNTDRRVNEVVLQNRISTQKMNLLNTLSQTENGEALLYQSMSGKINDIMEIKGSIRLLQLQVEQTRGDLQRCIQDNRNATRRMIFTNP